ncbi:SpaA isopeptide-forming pilin-related protein, partial [Streptomyces sp. NPDC087894]
MAILKKDPGGDVLAGAAFTLFDSAGKEAASGKTNAQGQLALQDLAPGVYR